MGAAAGAIAGGAGSLLGGYLGGRQQRAGMEAQARESAGNRQLSREEMALQEAIAQRQRQAAGPGPIRLRQSACSEGVATGKKSDAAALSATGQPGFF